MYGNDVRCDDEIDNLHRWKNMKEECHTHKHTHIETSCVITIFDINHLSALQRPSIINHCILHTAFYNNQ